MTTHTARSVALVPPEIGRVRFDAGKTIWLWGMAIPGLAGIRFATPATLAVSLALTFVTLCIGHSVGLHRGIIHRTYQSHPAVRGALAYLFVLSGLGGPLSWARLHAVRDLWQNRADCPPYFAYRHSAARDFVGNLHLRFEPADDRADARLPPDVLRDPWLRFLERTWPLHVLALALAILAVLAPAAWRSASVRAPRRASSATGSSATPRTRGASAGSTSPAPPRAGPTSGCSACCRSARASTTTTTPCPARRGWGCARTSLISAGS
jgi:hypothetical protein